MKLKLNKKKLGLGIGFTALSVATLGTIAVSCTACSNRDEKSGDITQESYKPQLKTAYDALIPQLNSVAWAGNKTVLPSEVTATTVIQNLNLKPDLYTQYFNYTFSNLRPHDDSGVLIVNVTVTSKTNSKETMTLPDLAIQGFLTTKEVQSVKTNFKFTVKDNSVTITSLGNKISSSLIIPKYLNNHKVTAIDLAQPVTTEIKYLSLPDSLTSISKNSFPKVAVADYYGQLTNYTVSEQITQGFSHQTVMLIHDSPNNLLCMYSYNDAQQAYEITYYKLVHGENNQLSVEIFGGHLIEKASGFYFKMPDHFVDTSGTQAQPTLFAPVNITYASREQIYHLDIDLKTRFTHHGSPQKPLVVTNMRPFKGEYYPSAVETFGKYAVLYTTDNGTYVYCAVSYRHFGYANIDQNFAVTKDGSYLINSANFTTANGLYYPNTTRYYIGAGGTTNIPVPFYILALPLSSKGITKDSSSITPLDCIPNNWIYGQINISPTYKNKWYVRAFLSRWVYWYLPDTYKGNLNDLIGGIKSFESTNPNNPVAGTVIVNSSNKNYLDSLQTYLQSTKVKLISDLSKN